MQYKPFTTSTLKKCSVCGKKLPKGTRCVANERQNIFCDECLSVKREEKPRGFTPEQRDAMNKLYDGTWKSILLISRTIGKDTSIIRYAVDYKGYRKKRSEIYNKYYSGAKNRLRTNRKRYYYSHAVLINK